MHPPVSRETRPVGTSLRWGAALGIALATFAVYRGSLSAPLVYDDALWITHNPSIRHLLPLSAVLAPPGGSVVAGRPLLSLSLALNYAAGGNEARGYHLANLAFHILAAVTLFGIVSRTLVYLPHRFATEADRVIPAFGVALLWALHPLQTESVTYVIQRAESLMGLFYLLTLFCFIRGAQAAAPRWWYVLCVLCCLLGMATKEVMVTAPLAVLAYDRTFVAPDLRGALRARGRLYLGLACTWLPLWLLAAGIRGRGVGYGLGYTWVSYALTECWVVPHYILLALWPHPLVFDYGMGLPGSLREVLPWACILAAVAAVTLLAFLRRKAAGFAGLWFFLILAPGSSIVPVAFQAMAEHRMYLPLAGIIAIGVGCAWACLGRRSIFPVLVAAVALGAATLLRNRDYRSESALWADTVRRRPSNERARLALGAALAAEGRSAEAREEYSEALRLDPGDFQARMGLGLALYDLGRVDEALAQYRGIAPPTPDSALLHYDIALALEKSGQSLEAATQLRIALQLEPGFAEAREHLGRLEQPRR